MLIIKKDITLLQFIMILVTGLIIGSISLFRSNQGNSFFLGLLILAVAGGLIFYFVKLIRSK